MAENESTMLDVLPIDDSMIEYNDKRDRFAHMFEQSVSSFKDNVLILDKYWFDDGSKLDKVSQYLPYAVEFKLNGLYYKKQYKDCLWACIELFNKQPELAENKELKDIAMKSLNRLDGSLRLWYLDWLSGTHPSVLANAGSEEDKRQYRSVKEL